MNFYHPAAWARAGLALVLCAALNAQAQTCAAPGRDGTAASSGTVNTYYPPASGTYTASSTSIPLGSRAGAAVAVAPGDLVVVMQMQCATVNTANSSNYGAGNGTGRGYTDPSGSCLAGRYQYVRAGAGTTNTSLDLSGSPLAAAYVQDATTATNRRTFQVIRVPQHSALTLTGTVNAPYWNGSTGGVVVLDVAGALNWNGQTVDVAGRGFRGGGGVQWTGDQDTDATPDYVATFASNQHAPKGEGIGGTPRWVLDQENSIRSDLGDTWGGYANGDMGRGAPGNAGGGGDNRNSGRDNGGGGGGGNGGIGGFGAYGWKNADWAGVFTASDVDLRGIGGGAFASAAPNRVVMGGGGGAGGSNNDGATPINSSGGAGGGIVVVRAGSMSGTGTVNANGAAGRTQPLNDGSGGGGAGGSAVLMSVGGGLGGVTVNARGGAGGDSYLGGSPAHAGGGGGAGGVVIRSGAATAVNVPGALNGTTNTGGNPVGGAAHGATPGAPGSNTTPGDSTFTTRPSAQCLPNLTVTKLTLTPTVTTAGATSVSYTIVVSNNGGAALGADLVDNTLPPGWTFAQTSALAFAPALSASTWGGFVEGATPGLPALAGSPGTAANLSTNGAPAGAPVWANLTLPGLANNIPGSVTLSFVVNVPASAPVGCFHNPAGVKYLDPTRSTAGREITPAANNTANRDGAQVGGTANTGYETNPGPGTTVGGSNYSGLPSGLSQEDVCLQGDLSITKTAPASVTAGQTLTYALTPRNNGRAISDLTFSTNQATEASNTSTTTRVLSNGAVRVVDTLPAGLTLTNPVAPAGWNCSQAGQTLTCDSTAPLPVAASTDLAAITGTVRVSNTACSGPLINTATVSGFQAPYADSTPGNNTGTASTTLNCNANLNVSKTNGTDTVVTGTTTTYSVVFTNNGPSSADGAVLTDVPGAGLSSCSVTSCSASGGSPVAASCPAAPADLLGPSGVIASNFSAGATLTFLVRCTVTASGT
jgi:uncharacterized repeat protein (TIGR01451 family)